MQQFLKLIAIVCKVVAIVAWLGVAWVKVGLDVSDLRATSQPMYRDAPEDWGTPAFYHRTYLEIFEICGYVLLAVIPNRWLISWRPVFWVALLLAFAPLGYFLATFSAIHSLSDVLWSVFAAIMMSPLFIFTPLSLILSCWRHKHGQKVTYA
jgi:hypothetical protein